MTVFLLSSDIITKHKKLIIDKKSVSSSFYITQKIPKHVLGFFNFIGTVNSLHYFTSINSTSKIKVAFGGIAPPAPRDP